MTFLALFGTVFWKVGLIWLAISATATVGFLLVMHGARRAEDRERRRQAELHAAKELRSHVQVIGGNRISSDERWGRAA